MYYSFLFSIVHGAERSKTMSLDDFTPKERFLILLIAFVVTCEGYKKATGIDILKGCVDDES